MSRSCSVNRGNLDARAETRLPAAGIVSRELWSSVLGRWYERARTLVLRRSEPASLGYRFMARLIEREFPRDASGVCLAFSAPDSDKASSDALLMLAYCLRSELGSRVLIVDARLKGQLDGITGRLGLGEAQGFAEILRDGIDGHEKIAVASSVPNVDVLPSGASQDEPTMPLDRLRLKNLLAAAVARYDYVLLQVSSPLRDTRALVIAAEANAMFLLAEDNRTFMTTLDECRKVLLANGVNDVRVVVTGARP